ncbi:MAG: serine dehydratase subunit alpha family protein [Firmicutes bacterium]|nr:serine dehydratase subunit alpha family protein [Bacillota bacterium]
MHELTSLIKSDMLPALGVTEPGAVAFCVSTAKDLAKGELKSLRVTLNSGMYKNGFTCGIPHCDRFGSVYAAALGYIAGEAEKGLLCLENVTEEDLKAAKDLVNSGKISVELGEITSRIYIEAELVSEENRVTVVAEKAHTRLTKITVDGRTLLDKTAEDEEEKEDAPPLIHRYTLEKLFDYAKTVPLEEIEFVKKAYEMNMALFYEGLNSGRMSFVNAMIGMNGGEIFSKDEEKTAELLCGGAIEARVMGLDLPAMSITGSGAHGIIATLPLLASQKICGYTEESLYRATALSYLVCMYIKEYSGKLSAFCGCGIAAGTGMACGLCLMKGGDVSSAARTINNMASSITGMICDGGNQGCAMKGIAATAAAFRSAGLALKGVFVDSIHGINGLTPEDTMRNMGLIASPGMVATEKTIVDIQRSKRI